MKTVVLGASDNPQRYSFIAVRRLRSYGHEVVPVSLKKGEIDGLPILSDKPPVEGVHTITMYVGPRNQPYWYDYILSLKPKRIIFNPGAENDELEEMARKQGIETIEACTLVMLSVGNY